MIDFDLISVDVTEPLFGIHIGRAVVRTHGPEKCAGEVCCIHNPSDHHMRSWPQLWREDRQLMERTCPHGVGHPDPDALAYQLRTFGEEARHAGVHGCDGCCGDAR
ncbi:MAG: hypothetical protein ACM30G_09010 [Micromonosporaceae bacterium]